MTIWEVLGIDATVEERAIKRAYASRLKVTRPDDDPTAFQLLNDSFQHALAHARHQAEAVPVTAQEAVAEVVVAPRPATPVRAPAGPSAAAQAGTLWAAFLRTSTVQPRMHLNKLSDGDALVNMDVREQFELCAARYCASDACTEELREAVVQHYQWEIDHALIARELPQETGQVMAYLRAERSWAFFQQHINSDQAVKALIGARPGVPFLQTCDANFMRAMRELVTAIHEYHPEMLLLKLDQERFAKWEERVARKRYFVQTAIHSFIAGLILALVSMFALTSLGGTENWFGTAFLGSMAACFGGFGWYAFKGPGTGRTWRDSALGVRLNHVLHDVRYRPGWQFGWLLPFVLVSTLLFVPEPGPLLRYFVAAVLVVCALFASFASSAVMNGVMFVIVLVGSVLLGGALSEKNMDFHPVTVILAAYCCILMLIRGGRNLLTSAQVKPGIVLPLRLVWMAGVVAIGAAAHLPLALGMPATYAAATWLWLCAGMLLAYPSINFIYAFIVAVMVNIVTYQVAPTPNLLAAPPFTQLFAGLTLVTIFMCVNMFRARGNQHPFS